MTKSENNQKVEKKVPKKRGRKPKNKKKEDTAPKIPKKRGRKPKGGKIIKKKNIKDNNTEIVNPNIILHLKCNTKDLHKENSLTNNQYNPNVIPDPEAYNLTDTSNFKEISTNAIIQKSTIIDEIDTKTEDKKDKDDISIKNIWKKIHELKKQLRYNNFIDKRSNCHWCTCSFDTPTIHIPSKIKNGIYEVYGCFCSPECATAFLMNEKLDNSTLWERYSMLNNIYSKIYDRNIKPAPNPLYTLNKYYGNLTIEEYRKLFENDTLLMIVDKPMSKILPELYEENNEIPNVYYNLLETKQKTSKTNQYRLQSKNANNNRNKLKIFNNIYSSASISASA